MAIQRQALINQEFNFVPTTLKEAVEYATIFANSGLCPENYKGRPNDILIVWQLGKEIGLDKMQALRTLGCVNGMPFAYGDGQLALIKRHPEYEWMKEWFEGTEGKDDFKACCTMKRKDQDPVTREFSVRDAKIAGLWEKKGVWQQYPKRMLQHRARGFCSKDVYPDALYGLKSEYEVRDIVDAQVIEVAKPKANDKGISAVEALLNINDDITEGEIIPIEIDEPQKTLTEDEIITNKLRGILEDMKIPKRSVVKWCKQFDVETIDQIPIEGKEKIINHLMETK